MATWMANVRFPDGHVQYATYCAVLCSVLDDLYDHFTTVGEADPDGVIIRKAAVAGLAEPRYPDRHLSDVNRLLPVRIDFDPDGENWAALFCPSQNQLIGPMNGMVIGDMQRRMALISQRGKLHLQLPENRLTLCGQMVTGKEVPYRDAGLLADPDEEPPARRDLYSEWHEGKVCRYCLLNALISYADWAP
ncbi:hypothetical protein [Paracoccus sp. (in: a-proteobacteria)]|uniref:hypothetical protein n=1 Tax=Paracoccus sp. TaxID=267 RepID=UPI0035B02DAF